MEQPLSQENTNSHHHLLTIENISVAFKNDEQTHRVVSVFYTSYKPIFVQWAKMTYRGHPEDLIEFIAHSSFSDGVMRLRDAAGRGELYQSNANIKTVLFSYCKMIMLGYLTAEKRLAEKKKNLQLILSNESDDEKESELKEKLYKTLMQALANLAVEDRQIIEWRHIENKSNDEIASLLGIKVESATSRIYRCMERLRKLMEDLNKGDS